MMQIITMPGLARDVAVGIDGTIWKVGADGRVARWDEGAEEWQLVAGPEDAGSRIAVQRDGSPWVVGEAGRVYRYQGGRWQTIPASARHLSATAVSDGMVMVDRGLVGLMSLNRRGVRDASTGVTADRFPPRTRAGCPVRRPGYGRTGP